MRQCKNEVQKSKSAIKKIQLGHLIVFLQMYIKSIQELPVVTTKEKELLVALLGNSLEYLEIFKNSVLATNNIQDMTTQINLVNASVSETA